MVQFEKLTAAVLVLNLLSRVEGHSWLDCVNWDASTQTCNGYARDWALRKAEPFGQDVGRDIRPGRPVPGGLFCDPQKEPRRNNPEDSYSDEYPMARVGAGQTVTMRWPAKNHAMVGTQRGVQIYFSRTADGGDDFSHVVSQADWVSKYPNLERTFSNCNPNTPGVDRAECTGEFEIPRDLDTGVYTLMWWWEFNQNEFYNSCADVHVTSIADGGQPTTKSPTPPPDPNAPTPQPTTFDVCPFSGTIAVQDAWNNGFVASIELEALVQISQWDVEISFDNGESVVNMWNCRLNQDPQSGVTLASSPVGYLSTLSPGQTVSCGFQAAMPEGAAPFGGEGAYVRVRGCETGLALPELEGTVGNGGNNGGESGGSSGGGESGSDPKCNSSGYLLNVEPEDGRCLQSCNCNPGSYGETCEEDSPQQYWEVTLISQGEAPKNFETDCDTQVSHRDLLKMALNIVAPQVELKIVLREAKENRATFWLYDNGGISQEVLDGIDEAIEFGEDITFTIKRNTEEVKEAVPNDGGLAAGLSVLGVICLGGVGFVAYRGRNGQVLRNGKRVPSTSSSHASVDIMAPKHISNKKLKKGKYGKVKSLEEV